MLKKKIVQKKVSLFTIFLPLSLLTNSLCLGYIYSQNQQIDILIKKNNDLALSINTLSNDLLKLNEQISMMQTNANAVWRPNTLSQTSFFGGFDTKYIMYLLGTTICIKTTMYIGSFVSAKLAGYTLVKIGKILSTSFLSKLPFFEKTKMVVCFLDDISTSIRITSLGDKIQNIDFKHLNERDYLPISEALDVFLKMKENETVKYVENIIDQNISTSITEYSVPLVATLPPAATLAETSARLFDVLSSLS